MCRVPGGGHLKTDYVNILGGGVYCHYENSCDESTTCGGAVHCMAAMCQLRASCVWGQCT